MSEPEPPDAAGVPDALERLLAPLDANAFFDRHWETAPLHVERGGGGGFVDLVSIEAIERALSRGELRFPDVQLTRAGTPVPSGEYTSADGRILARPLARHHRDGATVILSGAHRAFDALADFVRDLQARLGWRCQANAYLSPPGNSGFAPHHDTHDVFVLQVAGGKTFRFYTGGVDLPFSDERYDPATAGEREAGESIALSAGDTLYIPRGVAHDALAHADAPSLHVTVGVFPVVLRDVLIEAVQIAAERDVALRRSVPRALWRPSGRTPDDALGAPAMLDALDAALHADAVREALSRLRDGPAIDAAAEATGLLSGEPETVDVTPGTVLVVADGPWGAPERVGGALRLRRSGEVLELADPMAGAVEALFARGRCAVSELDGLDDEGRTALARRLLRHGACRAE